ncbi:MAG: hypothetical protein KDA85_05250, partial [Planctomycetaceae bacterium]|nr:hypothetical protein [Planctomycetaceae bacterium]
MSHSPVADAPRSAASCGIVLLLMMIPLCGITGCVTGSIADFTEELLPASQQPEDRNAVIFRTQDGRSNSSQWPATGPERISLTAETLSEGHSWQHPLASTPAVMPTTRPVTAPATTKPGSPGNTNLIYSGHSLTDRQEPLSDRVIDSASQEIRTPPAPVARLRLPTFDGVPNASADAATAITRGAASAVEAASPLATASQPTLAGFRSPEFPSGSNAFHEPGS